MAEILLCNLCLWKDHDVISRGQFLIVKNLILLPCCLSHSCVISFVVWEHRAWRRSLEVPKPAGPWWHYGTAKERLLLMKGHLLHLTSFTWWRGLDGKVTGKLFYCRKLLLMWSSFCNCNYINRIPVYVTSERGFPHPPSHNVADAKLELEINSTPELLPKFQSVKIPFPLIQELTFCKTAEQ